MIWPHQPKMCDHCGRKLALKTAEQIARELSPAQVEALRYTLAHPEYDHSHRRLYEYGLPGTRSALTARGLTVWSPGPMPPTITPLGLEVLEFLADTPQSLREFLDVEVAQ